MHHKFLVVVRGPVPRRIFVGIRNPAGGAGTLLIYIPRFVCYLFITGVVCPADLLYDSIENLVSISLDVLLVAGYAGS